MILSNTYIIKKSIANYSSDQINQLALFLNNLDFEDLNENQLQLDNYFSEIVVAELSGVPTPVKVVSYSVIDNNIPRNVTECTNLYTDAEVDYGEICSAKYINLL